MYSDIEYFLLTLDTEFFNRLECILNMLKNKSSFVYQTLYFCKHNLCFKNNVQLANIYKNVIT